MPDASGRQRRRRHTVVLSGPSRAGKTTVCRALIAEAEARGLAVAGVLTDDATAADGSRQQVAVDLHTGERRLLASAKGAATARTTGGDPTGAAAGALAGVPVGGWTFAEDGVAFGRAVLQTCLTRSCDLLVVDQIGPLELLEGGGWSVAFELFARGDFELALVVVNPRVIDRARELIGDCKVHVVDSAGRAALPATLAALLPPARP
jgi:nucleoside-triphosphatase THEP1